jgi:enoyl-CoA hydratase
VNRPTAQGLAEAFREFEQDPLAKVGVLYGEGGNFCAGADLKALSSKDPDMVNRLSPEGDAPMGPTRMSLSKPVIAAVAGYAVAGGLELAIWCDLRVVEESAVFGVFCRRFGVPLIDGGTVRLPRLIGMGRAMDMILTGRPVEAGEALSMGLANRVVPDGQCRGHAETMAAQIADFPNKCMLNDRRSAYKQWDMPFSQAMADEFEHGVSVIQSGESLEGATRFSKGQGRRGNFNREE